MERLRAILAQQAAVVSPAIRTFEREVAAAELAAQEALLARILRPLGLAPESAALGEALAAARSTPALGLLPREWIRGLSAGDVQRVLQTTRAAAQDGLTAQAAARSVVGTRSLGFRDGVREVSRRGLGTALQTLGTHSATQAQSTLWQANDDFIREERWTAMLDGRTSPICRALDGQIFPVGEGREPPAHPNCRSRRLPIIPELRAIPGAPDRDVLPSTVANNFDGQPPAVLTYDRWLRERSDGFQRRVLGPTRFDLFKTGEVQLDRFVNDRGRQLTIPELRRRLPDAFDEAGL